MQSDISPLFLNLKSSSTNTADLSHDQKEELIKKIKTFDEVGHEIIYILMRMYERDTAGCMNDLPYDSKLSSKELKIDVDLLPIQLKWMIYKFSCLHAEKMKEENMRTKLNN
jgi:hypothetical protein